MLGLKFCSSLLICLMNFPFNESWPEKNKKILKMLFRRFLFGKDFQYLYNFKFWTELQRYNKKILKYQKSNRNQQQHELNKIQQEK